ncbi:hypothetical protein M9H77_31274 [Catharanthus roseus]|uniref:Uncharacterized protein n=1 Tax=Catharanthus roseus TaxID=4058 RepID=A0ACB9ZZP2_CATRO|nr:hypothetical protein M9H77_31274 [Catharanthus roseus]
MDAIHPIRVVLFWDSEYARDVFGLYFTRAAKKIWTFTRMYRRMDPSQWNVRITMRAPSFYEDMNNDDKMRYLWTIRPNISKEGIQVLVEFELIQIFQMFVNMSQYPNIEEDDEDDDDADADYDVSSASDDNNSDNDKKDDISTPLYSLSSTAVNQWQNTIRLLDWNDAMTGLQSGMRFVDKTQAIISIQRWFIRIG